MAMKTNIHFRFRFPRKNTDFLGCLFGVVYDILFLGKQNETGDCYEDSTDCSALRADNMHIDPTSPKQIYCTYLLMG